MKNQINLLLRVAALGLPTNQADQLIALAKRIEHCSADDNQTYVRGTPHSAYSVRMWRCRSKLCDHCLQYRSAKQRSALRQILRNLKIPTGSNLNFVTFTIKNPGLPITETRAILNKTWRLFTKRSLFVDSFRGGSKTEEFTITPNGFHFHLHLLTVTKYLHFNEVRRVWTECFHEATQHTQLINTADSMLMVKILRVTNRDQAIFEVSKYVTKTWSFGRLSHEAVRDLGLMQRWNRQFEIFGNWKQQREIKTILDKENLSAESVRRMTTWRDHLKKIGLMLYLNYLENEVRDRQAFFRNHVLPKLQAT